MNICFIKYNLNEKKEMLIIIGTNIFLYQIEYLIKNFKPQNYYIASNYF